MDILYGYPILGAVAICLLAGPPIINICSSEIECSEAPMWRIDVAITFTDENGDVRQERQTIDSSDASDVSREHRIASILFNELKATVGERVEPKNNSTARKWLDFPNQPVGFEQYFNIRNSQSLWFELARLVMRAEVDLISAQAFKSLEPAQEPPFGDDIAIESLRNIHDRKVTLLNQSVYALIKVQDLVNRLFHESLGGDLVDTSRPDWERVELTRANVIKGLKLKLSSGLLTHVDFDAITQALAIPKNTTNGKVAKSYRDRLMHHIRPSIDYSMFYSQLESRVGEEVRDADGKVTGRRFAIYAKKPAEYLFLDLHIAYSEYLDAIVKMLQELSVLEILRR